VTNEQDIMILLVIQCSYFYEDKTEMLRIYSFSYHSYIS